MNYRRRFMNTDCTFRHACLAATSVFIVSVSVAWLGWSLLEFDRALFVYAQTLILALALTTYRFTIWLHRPPTWETFRAAAKHIATCRHRRQLGAYLLRRTVPYFAFNRFVWLRGARRWAAHWPIMLGCVMAMAIVVPLIFGWVWFETPADNLDRYHVMLLGLHIRTIDIHGWEAFLAFHGLVWASIPVLIGCSFAIWRRCYDRGDQATQSFTMDLLPLASLAAIALTGLLMTLSYSFFGGALHPALAMMHCVIVCATLLWLPYGKFFHIPQRSIKLAHIIVEHNARSAKRVECRRCGLAFAEETQLAALIRVQRRLGYAYDLDGGHYQFICPQCRRASLIMAQSARWQLGASSEE